LEPLCSSPFIKVRTGRHPAWAAEDRLGVEGLDFQSHKEIVIADEPDSFAQEVISLLRNPQRRRALGDAARERVVRRYSQEALRQALNEALVSVVGEPAIAGGQPND